MGIKTHTHTDACRANVYLDNDECNCEAPTHRAFGRLGSFTVHSPADYRPRHAF